jgi:hypothetical protein
MFMTTIGSRTPWGKADHVRQIAEGIEFIGTPRHGGYKLSRKLNAQVHQAWRKAGGWYEEDCEYAIVHYSFPELTIDTTGYSSPEAFKADAAKTAKAWAPDAYEAVTGEKVTAAESHVVAKREFKAAHVADFVTISAWGSWHKGVPTGKIGVMATPGGSVGLPEVEGRYFLVEAARFESCKGRFGYVIDPTVDSSWAGPY